MTPRDPARAGSPRQAGPSGAGRFRRACQPAAAHRILPVVLLVLVPAPHARGDTMVARCSAGGCLCTTSPVAAGDLARAVGLSGPAQAGDVLVSSGGLWGWRADTPAAIDRAFAGDGTCRADPVPVPADGLWQAHSRVTSVACGPNTALVRAHLEAGFARMQPARIIWNGRLDGAAFETAWRAANPVRNLEVQPWRADGPLVQRADIARRDRRSSARLELLDPDTLHLAWTLTTTTELTSCTVSVTQDLRRVAD